MTKASPLSNVPFSLISQEFRSRETRINELTSRKQTIETELSSIRSELAQLQNPTVETTNPGLAVAVKSKRPKRAVGRPPKNQTLRETVYSVLGKKKQKSVQINDIAEAVLQKGYNTLSDRTTFLKNIRNAMRGDPRFVKLGTGLFGLAENQQPINSTN